MVNGDTVTVARGNYEAGSFDPQSSGSSMFRLIGLYGNIMCVDDALSCVLNGSGTRTAMYLYGTSGGLLVLRGLVFANGYREYGGGLSIQIGVQVTLVVCSFQQNQGTIKGGGIEVSPSSNLVDLYGVSFSGNTSPNGPDIHVNSGTVTIHSTCSAGEN